MPARIDDDEDPSDEDLAMFGDDGGDEYPEEFPEPSVSQAFSKRVIIVIVAALVFILAGGLALTRCS